MDRIKELKFKYDFERSLDFSHRITPITLLSGNIEKDYFTVLPENKGRYTLKAYRLLHKIPPKLIYEVNSNFAFYFNEPLLKYEKLNDEKILFHSSIDELNELIINIKIRIREDKHENLYYWARDWKYVQKYPSAVSFLHY